MQFASAKSQASRMLLEAARSEFIGQRLGDIATPFLVLDLDVVERNAKQMRDYCAAKGVILRPHAKMHKSIALSRLQMDHGGAIGMCVQKVSEAEQLSGMFAAAVHAGDENNTAAIKGTKYIRNLFISNEAIGAGKIQRLAKLAKFIHAQQEGDTQGSPAASQGYLAVAVDSVAGIEQLAEALRAVGTYVYVLIEVDIGQRRGGCQPTEAALRPLSDALHKAEDVLRFEGIHAYHGAAQHIRSVEERRATMRAATALVAQARSLLTSDGFGRWDVRVVTGAGSGTFFLEGASGLYTELQAGSYLVLDRDYGENATALVDADNIQVPQFEHALFLQSAVTTTSCSAAAAAALPPPRLVLDGGHKSSAIDCGGPAVAPFSLRYAAAQHALHQGDDTGGVGASVDTSDLVQRLPDDVYVVLGNGGDDHSTLTTPLNIVPRRGSTWWPHAASTSPDNGASLAATVASLLFRCYGTPGAVMWLVPGHCDPTFNLHDIALCVRGLTTATTPLDVTVEDVLGIDARGCQQ